MTDSIRPEGCTAELRDWYLVPFDLGKPFPHFHGRVFGDVKKRWPDGTEIRTSPIVRMDGSIVETENSSYRLGAPLADREKAAAYAWSMLQVFKQMSGK